MSLASSIKWAFRDSLAGQTIYWVSGRRWLRPVFELESYIVPEKYLAGSADPYSSAEQKSDKVLTCPESGAGEKAASSDDGVDAAPIIVDWDGEDDPACPYNWPMATKVIAGVIMAVCSASLYMGAAIFTPAETQIEEALGTSRVKVMLGMALFVWGYGIASLWFSPMSENPLFGGRLYIFIANQVLFSVFQIPTALANHVAPFAILRLLAGFTAAPPLSTGTAVYSDLFQFPQVTYGVMSWSFGCIMGPYVGPLIGGALSQHNSWRWVFWYLLIQSGGVLLVMVLFFPETSSQAILMRKARSLRRRTGNPRIMAPGDIERVTQRPEQVLKYIFWNPVKLTLREPPLMLMNLHLGLLYGIMYLYFEAVPITYGELYGFNAVQQGLSYLSLLIGCLLLFSVYIVYIRKMLLLPVMRQESPNTFAVFGNAAVFASCTAPVAIMLFGWASYKHLHWIVSMIGNAMFGMSLTLIFQTYMALIAHLYPPSQVASAYASSNLARSLIAGAFPLFGRAMYNNLAIDDSQLAGGVQLLLLSRWR